MVGPPSRALNGEPNAVFDAVGTAAFSFPSRRPHREESMPRQEPQKEQPQSPAPPTEAVHLGRFLLALGLIAGLFITVAVLKFVLKLI